MNVSSENAITSMTSDEILNSEITLDAIHLMRDKLRKLNKSWVSLLAQEMSVEEIRIRNIIRGDTVSNEVRVQFINSANELYSKMIEEKRSALLIVESAKDSE